MRLVDCPSPNFNDRPVGKPVSLLVLHYTGMETAAAALERLVDPAAQVSAHYTVDEDGTVYVHVPEDKRAWHAGQSEWAGESDVNGISVGIEIVNPGHEFGYRPFPAAQIAAVRDLSKAVLDRHGIPAHRVVGHSDVAPDRKQDPGELFPWQALAADGIGIWPDAATGDDAAPADIARAQRHIRQIGYACPETGSPGPATAAVVTAFQRRFRPASITGDLDTETARLAAAVAALVPKTDPD